MVREVLVILLLDSRNYDEFRSNLADDEPVKYNEITESSHNEEYEEMSEGCYEGKFSPS